jgi:membrane protein
MAFFLMWSLFPALLFFVSLLPHLPLDARADALLDAIAPLVPAEVDAFLRTETARFLDRPRSGLAAAALVLSLFSASRALVSLSRALNRSHRVPELRSELGRRLRSMLLTLVLLYALAGLVVALTLGARLAQWMGTQGVAGGALASAVIFLRWPLLLFVGGAVVERLYHLLPDHRPPPRLLSVGGVAATLGWGLSTWVFSQLLDGVLRLHLAYGSVGTVIVLMAWLFLAALCLMLGGALNALIDRGLPDDEGDDDATGNPRPGNDGAGDGGAAPADGGDPAGADPGHRPA